MICIYLTFLIKYDDFHETSRDRVVIATKK
jgi:hypothetical protein